jgi:CheY-like chemotaxis protein
MNEFSKLVGLDNLDLLLVDDDEDVLFILQKVLGNVGATVRTAANASAALEAVRLRAPDVIVSDLDMPFCDGYSLIRQIRALPSPANAVPAIALTAHNGAAYRKKALSAGFNEHMAKPMRALQLIKAIKELRVVATSGDAARTA